GTSHATGLFIEALSGGVVRLDDVTQISDIQANAARRAVLLADGPGSTIVLPSLVSFSDNSFWNSDWVSSLSATNSGHIDAPVLTNLREVAVTLDGTGTLPVSSWTNWTDGRGVFSGADYQFMNL